MLTRWGPTTALLTRRPVAGEAPLHPDANLDTLGMSMLGMGSIRSVQALQASVARPGATDVLGVLIQVAEEDEHIVIRGAGRRPLRGVRAASWLLCASLTAARARPGPHGPHPGRRSDPDRRLRVPEPGGGAPHPRRHPGGVEEARATGKRLCTAAEWRRARQARAGGASATPPGSSPTSAAWASTAAATRACSGPGPDRGRAGRRGHRGGRGLVHGLRDPEGLHDLVGNVEKVRRLERSIRSPRAAPRTPSAALLRPPATELQPDYRLDDGQPVSPPASAAAGATPGGCGAPRPGRRRAAGRAGAGSRLRPRQVELASGLFMDAFEHPNRLGSPAHRGELDGGRRGLRGGGQAPVFGRGVGAAAPDRPADPPHGDTYVPRLRRGPRRRAPHRRAPRLRLPGGRPGPSGAPGSGPGPLDEPALSPSGATLREVRGGFGIGDGDKAVCRPRDGYPAAAAAPDTPTWASGVAEVRPRPRTPRTQRRAPAPRDSGRRGVHGPLRAPQRARRRAHRRARLRRRGRRLHGGGARLCTEEEWEAACEGRRGGAGPGDTYARGRCHVAPYGPGDAPRWPADPDPAAPPPRGSSTSPQPLEARAVDGTGSPRRRLGPLRRPASPPGAGDPHRGEPGPAYGARCCHPDALRGRHGPLDPLHPGAQMEFTSKTALGPARPAASGHRPGLRRAGETSP